MGYTIAAAEGCGKGKREETEMKKVIVLLAAVMILAGSMGMTASAGECAHEKIEITAGTYTNTYTHPAWVANKPNGDPVLVPCTATETWQKYKTICRYCGELYGTREECVSVTHSVHH